jgi:hypothetical protein
MRQAPMTPNELIENDRFSVNIDKQALPSHRTSQYPFEVKILPCL